MITTALPTSPEVSQLRNGLWTATVEYVVSKWHAHPDDERTPRQQRPLTEQSRRWALVLGVTDDEVEVYVVRERHTTPDMYGYESIERDLRLVSTRPFVVVKVADPDEYYGYYRYGLVAARQVRDGHLGRKPQLTRVHAMQPKIVASDMRDPGIGLNRTVSWVQLSELVEITGIDAADILRDYAPFSPSNVNDPNVPLARYHHARIDYSNITRVYTTRDLSPDGYCMGESAWGGDTAVTLEAYAASGDLVPQELWVPQTFANRVIRLASFGYRPGQPLPVASCQIAAPMPVQPQLPLPVLPAEELRGLHGLRMELVEELPQAHFQRAAVDALSFSGMDTGHHTAPGTIQAIIESNPWCEAPDLTDLLNGFAYYTDFKQLERVTDHGRVVISTCSWTRAGVSKSNNYYAGFLAVFPEGSTVTDARRDPSAILRIWFWPGELVRQTPNGSKGGLCPPEVPADCAKLVERFLLNLGYDF